MVVIAQEILCSLEYPLFSRFQAMLALLLTREVLRKWCNADLNSWESTDPIEICVVSFRLPTLVKRK
jgi:hypothetical protein